MEKFFHFSGIKKRSLLGFFEQRVLFFQAGSDPFTLLDSSKTGAEKLNKTDNKNQQAELEKKAFEKSQIEIREAVKKLQRTKDKNKRDEILQKIQGHSEVELKNALNSNTYDQIRILLKKKGESFLRSHIADIRRYRNNPKKMMTMLQEEDLFALSGISVAQYFSEYEDTHARLGYFTFLQAVEDSGNEALLEKSVRNIGESAEFIAHLPRELQKKFIGFFNGIGHKYQRMLIDKFGIQFFKQHASLLDQIKDWFTENVVTENDRTLEVDEKEEQMLQKIRILDDGIADRAQEAAEKKKNQGASFRESHSVFLNTFLEESLKLNRIKAAQGALHYEEYAKNVYLVLTSLLKSEPFPNSQIILKNVREEFKDIMIEVGNIKNGSTEGMIFQIFPDNAKERKQALEVEENRKEMVSDAMKLKEKYDIARQVLNGNYHREINQDVVREIKEKSGLTLHLKEGVGLDEYYYPHSFEELHAYGNKYSIGINYLFQSDTTTFFENHRLTEETLKTLFPTQNNVVIPRDIKSFFCDDELHKSSAKLRRASDRIGDVTHQVFLALEHGSKTKEDLADELETLKPENMVKEIHEKVLPALRQLSTSSSHFDHPLAELFVKDINERVSGLENLSDTDLKQGYKSLLGPLLKIMDLNRGQLHQKMIGKLSGAFQNFSLYNFLDEVNDKNHELQRIKNLSPEDQQEALESFFSPALPDSFKQMEKFNIDINPQILERQKFATDFYDSFWNVTQGNQVSGLSDLKIGENSLIISWSEFLQTASRSEIRQAKRLMQVTNGESLQHPFYWGQNNDSQVLDRIIYPDDQFPHIQNNNITAEIGESLAQEQLHMFLRYAPNALKEFRLLTQAPQYADTLGKLLTQENLRSAYYRKAAKGVSAEEELFGSLVGIARGSEHYSTMNQQAVSLMQTFLNSGGKEILFGILDRNKTQFINNFSHQKDFMHGGVMAAQTADGYIFDSQPPPVDRFAESFVVQGESLKRYLKNLSDLQSQAMKKIDMIKKYRKLKPEMLDSYIEGAERILEIDKSAMNAPGLTPDVADEIISGYIKDNDGITDELDKVTDEISKVVGGSVDVNPIKKIWNNTNFLSVENITSMFPVIKDYIERRFERKQKRKTGIAGRNIFRGVPFLDGAANEFDRMYEDAEQQEVDKIKQDMANKSGADAYDFMEKASNTDEVKAGLFFLAEKGLLDWNNEIIWGAIERVGGGVQFFPSDKENTSSRTAKLQKALTSLYDADVYQELETQNSSNYDGGVSKFSDEAAKNLNQLKQNLNGMLEDHVKGIYISPHRYEAYVKLVIEAGKMTGDAPIYYLILGVSRGIIPVERLDKFESEYINKYPPIQFVQAVRPTRELMRQWEREIRGDEYKEKDDKGYRDQDFEMPKNTIHWMQKNILMQKTVEQRTIANLPIGKDFDHDHARFFAGIGDIQGADGILSMGSTGSANFKPTIYNNIPVGILENISSLSLQYKEIPQDRIQDIITRQAGYFAMFSGISEKMTAKKSGSKEKFSFTDRTLKDRPREGGAYNKDMNTQDFLDASKMVFFDSVPALAPIAKVFLDPQYKGSHGETKALQYLSSQEVVDHFTSMGIPSYLFEGIKDSKLGMYDFIKDTLPQIFDLVFKHQDNVRRVIQRAQDLSAGKELNIKGETKSFKYKGYVDPSQ